MRKELAAPVSGPLSLAVEASTLWLNVVCSAEVTTAYAKLSGPDEVVGALRERPTAAMWALTLPRTSAPSATTVIDVGGTTTIVGSTAVVGAVIGVAGDICIGGGRVTVNRGDVSRLPPRRPKTRCA